MTTVRRQTLSIVISAALIALVLTPLQLSAPPSAAAAAAPSTSRIAGQDRYATSVAISKYGFPDGAPIVFVATGTNYPDALSAAAAAAKMGGPLLLTAPGQLLSNVRSEIDRLHPDRIVVVGGPDAVSAGVFDELKHLTAKTVSRVWGNDRYETARQVVKLAFGDAAPTTVYLATGENFPDALSAGAVAGAQQAPVIIIPGASPSLDNSTIALLKSLQPHEVIVAGGPSAINPAIDDAIRASVGTDVLRVAGGDRYQTSYLLNSELSTQSPTAFVASGVQFADALAGSAVAAARHAPLFVTPVQCVAQSDLQEMQSRGVSTVNVLGGPSALGPGIDALTTCPYQKQAMGPGDVGYSVDSTGTLWQWGGSSATAHPGLIPPTPMHGLPPIREIATNDRANVSYAIAMDGTVWAFGGVESLLLGNGSTGWPSATPVEVQNLSDVVSISSAGYATLALKSDGTVWAWGYNDVGQLGDGSRINSSIPVQVPNLSAVTRIFATVDDDMYAVTADGATWAWGNNSGGRLGDGSAVDRLSPVRLSGMTNVVSITNRHAVTEDGSVWAWGSRQAWDDSCELAPCGTPIRVPGITDAVSASSTGGTTFVTTKDGTAWAWGSGAQGRLGDGRSTDEILPVRVRGLSDVREIVIGGDDREVSWSVTAYAVEKDGSVWAWGGNQHGMLGTGTTDAFSSIPVKIAGLAHVQTISSNLTTALAVALTTDGNVWAWGSGDYGQLGTGADDTRTVPTELSFIG